MRLIARCSVLGEGGDWRRNEEQGDHRFLCFYLHVFLHNFADYHESHHLVINSQASVYEVLNIKRRGRQIDSSIWRRFFLVNCGLTTLASKRSSSSGSRSANSYSRVSSTRVGNFQVSAYSKSRNSSPGTSRAYTRIFLLWADGWGIPGTINCFRSELILADVQSRRFQLVHGTLYICYSVSYAWRQIPKS